MMQILPPDFVYEKYGFRMRFVNTEDSQFIVDLRTQKKTSGFLHNTSTNVQNQAHWIELYKSRERKGEEYYFVIEQEAYPYGVIRLYNIHDVTYTMGSWVMRPDAPIAAVLASVIMVREIAFDILQFEIEDAFDGTNLENKKVLKFNLSWGMKPYNYYSNDLGDFVSLRLTREDFKDVIEKKIKLLKQCI